MVNKLSKVFPVIFAALIVNVIILCSNTSAFSQSLCLSQIGSNSAIQNVCSQGYAGGERRGAMWINDSSGFSTNTDVYITQASGTMNVYLHRAVIRGTVGVDRIKIVQRGLSSYQPTSYNSSNLGEVNWLNISGSIGGSGYRDPSKYWTYMGQVSGTLDIDKFREETGCGNECSIPVYIYRCAKTGADYPCGTDRVTVHFKLDSTRECIVDPSTGKKVWSDTRESCEETPPPQEVCSTLASDLGISEPSASDTLGITGAISGVKKNDTGKWQEAVFVKPKDNIKFFHCYYPEAQKIKKSDSHPSHRWEDHWECGETSCPCGGEDDPHDCCCGHTYYDVHAANSGRNTYIANDAYYNLVATDSSYRFKEQVVQKNNSIPFNQWVSLSSRGSRDTKPASIASPELNSSSYNCGTSPLGTYTIVGTDPRNCTSGINNSTWDPGTTFEQHIHYGGAIEAEVTRYGSNCPESDPPHSGDTRGRHAEIFHTNGYYANERVVNGEGDSNLAQVVVPYNFDTEISVSMYSSSVVYPGATITSRISGSILPKNNADVGGTYATITPGSSRVEVAHFLLPAWAGPSGLEGSNNYDGSPADYARNIGGQDIQSRTIGSGPFNTSSNNYADLDNWLSSGGEVRSVVPDVDTGTKLCTVAGIWPSDSHGIPDQGVGSGGNGIGYGPGQNSFGNWRISGVTCRTIAKKPTFQVWSGGVYTGSYIQTSITDKCLNSGILIEQDCNRTVYGSWAEYEAIARGPITNFASASGYGFSSTPDPHGGGGRAGGISKSTYNDPYNYSHATISNNGSAGAISANLGLSNIGVDDAFLARIISRYGSTTGGYDSCNIGPIDEWQVRNAPGRVLTFRCPGTANINGNIITGHDYYSKIDEIPQVIIIANDININSNVTEVDAWLIATNNTNIATGSINTCPQFSRGTTSSASSRDYRIHDDACTNQLTINGPVIAGRVYLNRTSGAYPYNNSIEPAEVFNLRADAYLWGYSQSEDFHQAVTTYTREVAPRY